MISMPDHTSSIKETKTYRKELKMKPSIAESVKRAADAVGMDMSTFISSAAYKSAQEIEQAQHQTFLSDDAFDTFAAAVDHPGQRNKALGQLFKHQKALIADG